MPQRENAEYESQQKWASKALAKRGHIVAATLCPAMLPVLGKTWKHCCAPSGHKKYIWRFSKTFYVSRTQNLCPPQMMRARRNEDTFGQHNHVSNVAAKMCPRFCRSLIHISCAIHSTAHARHKVTRLRIRVVRSHICRKRRQTTAMTRIPTGRKVR